MSNFIRLSVPRQQDAQSNAIVVNANENTIAAANSDACYITPIRNQSGFPQSLYYDPATGEIAYADTSGGGGGGGGQWTKTGNLLAPIPTDVSGIALMNTIIRGTDLSACVIGGADNEIGDVLTNWTFIAGGANKVSVPVSNFGYYCTIGGSYHKIGMSEGFVSGSFNLQGAISAGSSAFGASNRIGGVGANTICPFGFAFGSGNAIGDASGSAADHCVVGGDGNKIASGDVNAVAAASIALGKSNIIASGSDSDAQYCVAIGRENKIAIGANDECYTSVALGSNNTISAQWCNAIGSGNECSQRGASAYGWGNLADASYACARGKECNARGISSLADGSGSIARTTCSVALGCGADANGSCGFVYRDTCGNTFCFDSGGGPGNGQLLINGTAGAGGTGPTGPQGGFGGVTTCYYQDPSSNLVQDPTAGYMYFRTATTQYAASMLIVDASDCNQTNITEYMKTIMDSPNPSVKGHVRVSDSFSGTDNYLLYEINDLSYSGATPAWFEISVNGVASSSPSPFNPSLYPPNELYLTFARMGDIGAEGPQGVTGPTGPAGSGSGGGGASPWHYDSSDNFYGPTGGIRADQVFGVKHVIASNLNTFAAIEGSGNVAIGWEVGTAGGYYGENNILIGFEAGGMQGGDNNICIGARGGGGGGQSNNILLGQGAGGSGGLSAGGLVINATSATSLAGVNNGCVIKPIRNDSQVNSLFYDTTTGEITYDTATSGSGGGASYWKLLTLSDGANVLEPSANAISGLRFKNTIIKGTDLSGITIGVDHTASGEHAIAMGKNNTATGDYSVAMGEGTETSGDYSFADGSGSIARTTCSVALGCGADASGTCGFVYRDTCGNSFCFDSGGLAGSGQLLVNGVELVSSSGTWAPLNSPAFTGTPTAPTAAGSTNTTQLATTAFVQGEVGTNTTAISTNATNIATNATDISLKANIDSQAFTGTPSLPTGTTAVTQASGNNSTKLATTAFVQGEVGTNTTAISTNATNIATNATDISLKANIASQAFTGTPSLPTGTTAVTQASGNNSTKLATTAFVQSEVGTNTADITTNTTNIATNATNISLKANIASQAFTGTPSLPTGTTAVTQASNNDSTRLATTAFVKTAVGAVGGADAWKETIIGGSKLLEPSANDISGINLFGDITIQGTDATQATIEIGRDCSAIATTSTTWDFGSLAIGAGCVATRHSIAIGGLCEAGRDSTYGYGGIAIGLSCKVTGTGGYSSIAMGESCRCEGGPGAIAMGLSCHAFAKFSTAMGYYCGNSGVNGLETGDHSLSVGRRCVASGGQSVAAGEESFARGVYSVALGNAADASGTGGFVYRDICSNTFVFDTGGSSGSGQLLINGVAVGGGGDGSSNWKETIIGGSKLLEPSANDISGINLFGDISASLESVDARVAAVITHGSRKSAVRVG